MGNKICCALLQWLAKLAHFVWDNRWGLISFVAKIVLVYSFCFASIGGLSLLCFPLPSCEEKSQRPSIFFFYSSSYGYLGNFSSVLGGSEKVGLVCISGFGVKVHAIYLIVEAREVPVYECQDLTCY